VSGGGRLSRVDVSDDNDVDVSLIFTHFCRSCSVMFIQRNS
jgi:hypothetical protein